MTPQKMLYETSFAYYSFMIKEEVSIATTSEQNVKEKKLQLDGGGDDFN